MMASVNLSEIILLLVAALSCQWPPVASDYHPIYGRSYSVFFNASMDSRRYPDFEHIVEDEYNYFLGDLNFDAVSGKIVCGAADKLYILTTTDLTEAAMLTWEPETSKTTECASQNADTVSYTCRNHIRVYRSIPTVTDSTALLVCGSQATKTPQCRVVEVEDVSQTVQLQGFTTIDASAGIASYYPGFSQFGEFRKADESDTTYFSAGFFEGTNGLGRHFSISYQAISVSDTPAANSLITTERFRTISANNNWLRFPVTFIDYLRLDYAMPTGGNEYDYQFYFAFIRENLYSPTSSSENIIHSRVVRICRNDNGIAPSLNDVPYFTTYMKARIFCERQLETGDQYDGAIKYFYNELRSISYTDGGRYYVDGDYGKKLYGAFAGPVVGPHGTAICVYSAENTAPGGGTGRSQSMFDIFREDLEGMNGEVENNFIACDPAGRSAEDAQNILVDTEKYVAQLGNDPLIVLDGLLVNQMVQDEQCVVKRDDPSKCSNQDILFLGTDAGKVLKVVFASSGSGMTNVFPVIAEEIALDDDNNIEKMTIHEDGVGETRHLFVNTHSKVYKFPLQRCSRHQSCLTCIGSRDPYCVWDTQDNVCIFNTFQTDQNSDTTIDSTRYKQNIHSGEDPSIDCAAEADCELIISAPTYNTIQVESSCINTNQIAVAVTPSSGLTVANPTITLDGSGTGSTTISGSVGLQSYTVEVTAEGSVFTSVVTTPPGPPQALTTEQVLVDSVTTNSFRVSLNIDLFTDYFTTYSFKIDDIMSNYQPFSVSTSYIVTGLSPATSYTYTVVLRNSIDSVDSAQLITQTLEDTPSAVQTLVATPTKTSVALTWVEPAVTNGAISGYAVRVVGGEEVRGCGGWGGSPTTSYVVTGLTPFADYEFEVTACTSAGEGPAISVSSKTLCSAPGPVTSLEFTTITSSSMPFSWDQPDVVNGDTSTLQYEVQTVCYNEDGPATGGPDSLSVTQSTLTDLSPLTLCCATVTAVNNCAGQSSISGLPTEICDETVDITPGVVRSLVVTGVNHEGILVTWDPPVNYEKSGLVYNISLSGTDSSSFHVTTNDRAYSYFGSLDSSVEYNASVLATSSVGSGPTLTVGGSTLPSPPPAPTNALLTVLDDDIVTLQLSWSFPNASTYQVIGYEAVMRCNEDELPMRMTPELLVTFNVDNPGSDFAWCTAQVRAESSAGKGTFSSLATIALPSKIPSTPRCYLVDDQGSSVTVSFDVTHPFSLDSLYISYKLVADYQTPASVSNMTKVFSSLSSNVLMLDVARNTGYDFQLSVCNGHGCSDYCQQLRNFTTSSTAPRPPSDISVADITHNSATLSWSVPTFENASQINYILQLSSSGSGSSVSTLPGAQTELYREGLAAETVYTVAIRVNDTVTGTVGMFGAVTSFTTLIGTPSAPRILEISWNSVRRLLTVTWGVPETLNGTLTRYEIAYSDLGSTVEDCDKLEGVVVRNESLPVDETEFKTTNADNIIQSESKSIFVCVRAHTDKPGDWASYALKDIVVGAQGGNEEDAEQNCNGLIAVAVVAALAVLSTVAASVVLCVVIRRHNQIMRDGPNKSCEDMDSGNGGTNNRNSPAPSGQSGDTGFHDYPSIRPPLNSEVSTDSTFSHSSIRPLVRHNGKR